MKGFPLTHALGRLLFANSKILEGVCLHWLPVPRDDQGYSTVLTCNPPPPPPPSTPLFADWRSTFLTKTTTQFSSFLKVRSYALKGGGEGQGRKTRGMKGRREEETKKREKEGREGSCMKICYIFVMFIFWACLIGNWPSIWPATKTVALWTLITELYPLNHLQIGLFRKWHASRKRIAHV